MSYSKQYKQAFKYLKRHTTSRNLSMHTQKLKELESVYSTGLTFYFITNAAEQKYLYFTDNVLHCTGFQREVLLEKGVPFVLSRVHPGDRKIWTDSISILMDSIDKSPVSRRLNYLVQFDYRFLNSDENYVRMMDCHIPLELDDRGYPFLYLGHATVMNTSNGAPATGTISYLNTENRYKVVAIVKLDNSDILSHFTKREKEVLRLTFEGLTSEAIAHELFISFNTVNTHRNNINKKIKAYGISKFDLAKLL